MAPMILVMTICPNAPTTIAIAPKSRFLGDRKNILPPYSPIRLGVKIAQVKPQKTDSIACQTVTLSIRRTRYFHFNDSINQFKNIKANTIARME